MSSLYYIREPRKDELFEIVELSERVLSESPTYTHCLFSKEKCANLVYAAIDKNSPNFFFQVIAEKSSNKIAGGLMAWCEELTFSTDKVAYDITIMMNQEHRGRCLPELVEMIMNYKDWALAQGAKVIKMGVSSQLNIDSAARFLERLGFARIGSMHGWVIDNGSATQ